MNSNHYYTNVKISESAILDREPPGLLSDYPFQTTNKYVPTIKNEDLKNSTQKFSSLYDPIGRTKHNVAHVLASHNQRSDTPIFIDQSITPPTIQSPTQEFSQCSPPLPHQKNIGYQKIVNDDIYLIDDIEAIFNGIQVKNNNKFCPFCLLFIDIQKSSIPNFSIFYSKSTQKYYFTHKTCQITDGKFNYLSPKIRSLRDILIPKVNCQLNALRAFDTQSFFRGDKKPYLISFEAFHPISTAPLFKFDKISYSREHEHQHFQLLYVDLQTASLTQKQIFEPNMILFPYDEFRALITIHHNSLEEPSKLEFIVDLSNIKMGEEGIPTSKFAEVSFDNQGNDMNIAFEIIWDPNLEQVNKLNYKLFKDDITKNNQPKTLFYVMKYFTIGLPLNSLNGLSKSNNMKKQMTEQNINKFSSKSRLNPNSLSFGNFKSSMKQQAPMVQNILQAPIPSMAGIQNSVSMMINMGYENNHSDYYDSDQESDQIMVQNSFQHPNANYTQSPLQIAPTTFFIPPVTLNRVENFMEHNHLPASLNFAGNMTLIPVQTDVQNLLYPKPIMENSNLLSSVQTIKYIPKTINNSNQSFSVKANKSSPEKADDLISNTNKNTT